MSEALDFSNIEDRSGWGRAMPFYPPSLFHRATAPGKNKN